MTNERQRLDTDERKVLEKSEILLVDADESARKMVGAQLEAAGAITTATPDSDRALTLAREKHFPVILVDADTPASGQGIELLRRFMSASPASAVMLVTGDESFEHAVEGFRRGASDVASKAQIGYLTNRVVALCLESRRADERDQLLRDTLELHDQFLRRLMEAYRRAEMVEEAAAGQSAVVGPCRVLVVDDNPRTAPGLQQALGTEAEFRCVGVPTGGEALDHALNETPDIALVKENLPDLSGTMVARTLCSQLKESIVLLFEHPGQKPGYASIIETGQTIELIAELTKPVQLVDRIRGLHEAYATKKREKRYVQSFRQTHTDFLKQFVGVRQRIQKLLPEEGR